MNGSTAHAVDAAESPRPRGRPRLDIDRDAVADAVAELFAEGGYEAVSIADTAAKLSVSRSTLYRTVPTKDDLLGILFERGTRQLTEDAQAVIAAHPDAPGDQMRELLRIQIRAAVSMRNYLPVFFGEGNIPPDVYGRWQVWAREYEILWRDVVARAMEAGAVEKDDPVVTARLLLGMCIWVSRWYRARGTQTADDIADAAIGMLRLGVVPDA
ncbi:TetR/AcrR family transcriptional regulator [Actinomycetospora sp. TBRC 11914]|nr:TetR/AcrR family transcriptional regulator [Actinomycetospora sp. TBRC 11914]